MMVKEKTVLDGNKRKDASVTMHSHKNLSQNDQWEVNLDATPEGSDRPSCDNWIPRKAKDRPTPHKKINECDH